MRRFRGKTWLNLAATLLLAAVISPMADATHARGTDGSVDRISTVSNIRTIQASIQSAADAPGIEASSKPTLLARVELSPAGSSAIQQIPVGLTGGVYYDTREAQSESSPSAASSEDAPLFGIVAPGKWTSLLSTVLLVGFLFLRRAS